MITIMSHTNVQFSVASHLLAALTLYQGEHATSTMLAQSINADPSFVRRVLSKLSKAGLVIATRGKNGACALARDPADITLLDIYKASEAPATFAVHTYPIEAMCPISCHIKEVMAEVLKKSQSDFELSLSDQTLADITASIKTKY
ncbi:BadM/Rrf2 family transcriptional regulator [Glaciimonas sp. PCH181]|nr:BadM/Rrf2 family transcriptional regulator [Glaciimonas sp. PCH181]